jgi:hypothetical protein
MNAFLAFYATLCCFHVVEFESYHQAFEAYLNWQIFRPNYSFCEWERQSWGDFGTKTGTRAPIWYSRGPSCSSSTSGLYSTLSFLFVCRLGAAAMIFDRPSLWRISVLAAFTIRKVWWNLESGNSDVALKQVCRIFEESPFHWFIIFLFETYIQHNSHWSYYLINYFQAQAH